MPSSKNPDEKSGVRPAGSRERPSAERVDGGMQEDLQKKTESLAREHSQKREIRLREERVRHLSSEPDSRREGSSGNTKSGGGRVTATSGRASRLDDFPTDDPDDGPAPQASAPAPQRPIIEPLSRGPQGVVVSEDPRPEGVVDDVAVELEELIRDMRAGWRKLEQADRITFVAAVLTLVGVFLPWVTDPAHPTFPKIGLFAGGVVHATLAVAAMALVVRRSRGRYDSRGMRISRREQQQQARRASLWHILLGAASTAAGVYFLVLLILARAPDWAVKVHFGLYWTLLAGTGLSYGGFARFLRRED